MLGAILAAGLASAANCSCASTFEAVADGLENNYAGYVVKLPDQRSREVYRQFRSLAASDARLARNPEECRGVIAAYLAFFADEHLSVTHVSGQPTARAADLANTAPAASQQASAPDLPKLKARWTPDKVEFRLRRETDLDPVEGLWRDAEGQFAIVHDDALERGEYAAFRFRQHHFGGAGEILAFIRPANDGGYHIHYKDGNDVWQKTRARLNHETGILSFGNTGWQRTTKPATQTGKREDPSLAVEDMPLQRTADPLAPVLRELGRNVHYLSLPSFLPRFREPLRALLAENAERLATADGLVIDLRGNSGGDEIYLPLVEYLADGPVILNEPSAVLASNWNIEYVETVRAQLAERGNHLEPVLERMRANRGEIVPYLEARVMHPGESTGPKQVVVLQDRSVGSAAEALLLQVAQSDKVVTMGEASKGNIDYREPDTRVLGCDEYLLSLRYPVFMRSLNLPADALDDRGIAPDVRLSMGTGDWIEYARRWLRAGASSQ